MDSQHAKIATDIVAAGTFTAAVVGWLPTIAAVLSIVWILMQIIINFDKFTAKVKGWFK